MKRGDFISHSCQTLSLSPGGDTMGVLLPPFDMSGPQRHAATVRFMAELGGTQLRGIEQRFEGVGQVGVFAPELLDSATEER